MAFTVKPDELQVADFVRFSLLRRIANHKCKCGERQLPLAVEVCKVFGGETAVDVKVAIQPWKKVLVKARDRQITKAGIAQVLPKKLARKYGLSIRAVRAIIDRGINKVFKIGDLPPPI